jgi:hypothetical protein
MLNMCEKATPSRRAAIGSNLDDAEHVHMRETCHPSRPGILKQASTCEVWRVKSVIVKCQGYTTFFFQREGASGETVDRCVKRNILAF